MSKSRRGIAPIALLLIVAIVGAGLVTLVRQNPVYHPRVAGEETAVKAEPVEKPETPEKPEQPEQPEKNQEQHQEQKQERKSETQIEVHDNGQVEFQFEGATSSAKVKILPNQASSIAKVATSLHVVSANLVAASASATGDNLVYQFEGTKSAKLLGLIPVTFPVTTEVGAQTGQVVNINQPLWVNLLGFLIR